MLGDQMREVDAQPWTLFEFLPGPYKCEVLVEKVAVILGNNGSDDLWSQQTFIEHL